MNPETSGSITRWIGGLKSGDQDAARALWERYFDRLARLARAKLAGVRSAVADEEDAALSAFDSFCRAAEAGRFPQLGGRDDLWRLLVSLTARKAINQRKHAARLKRGGGRVLDEAALAAPGDDEAGSGLAAVVGDEPTPEFAAMVAEEYQRLLEILGDDALRQIALWKLEGETNDRIAERLGRSPRTVAYKLELIRKLWEREAPE